MVDASEIIDLGWKAPREEKGDKKKRRKSAAQGAKDTAEPEEQREATAVRPSLLTPYPLIDRLVPGQPDTAAQRTLSASLP